MNDCVCDANDGPNEEEHSVKAMLPMHTDPNDVAWQQLTKPNILVVFSGINKMSLTSHNCNEDMKPGNNTTDQIAVEVECIIGNELKKFETMLSCTVEHQLKLKYIVNTPEQLVRFNRSISQTEGVIELKQRSDAVLLFLMHQPVSSQEHACQYATNILSNTQLTDQYALRSCIITNENIAELTKKIMLLEQHLNVQIIKGTDANVVYFVYMKCQEDIVEAYLQDLLSSNVNRNQTNDPVVEESSPLISTQASPYVYSSKTLTFDLPQNQTDCHGSIFKNISEIISEQPVSKLCDHSNKLEQASDVLDDTGQEFLDSVNIELKDEMCCRYTFENTNFICFLLATDFTSYLSKKYTLNILLDETKQVIKIHGNDTGVKKAIDEIRDYEKRVVMKTVQFHAYKAIKYFTSDFGKKYLDSIQNTNNVSITIRKELNRGKSIEDDGNCNPPIAWTLNGKLLILVKGTVQETNASVLIFKKNPKGICQTTDALYDLNDQPWIDGNSGEIRKLEEFLIRVLYQANLEEKHRIAISLEPPANWPYHVYLRSLFTMSEKLFAPCEKMEYLIDIILCAKNDSQFSDVMKMMDTFLDKTFPGIECIELLRKDIFPQKEVQVKIIEGELDKIQANVIVNTTATNLDLSYGKVSAAILRSAGQELQAECRKIYPNGFHNEEIAITAGHNLKCSLVYHISLRQYSLETDMECIQHIRLLMWKCLKTATEHGVKSIAFPAIGTGVLKYPPDIVASEMFTSVDRFKSEFPSTSLEEILFVIYKRNKNVLQAFSNVQENIALTENKSICSSRKTITLSITGVSNDVDNAVHEINNKSIRIPIELNDIIEVDISKITDPEYYAIMYFCKTVLEQFSKMGVGYRRGNNNKMIIKGKFTDIEEAISQIKLCIDKVRGMPVRVLKVYSQLDIKRVKHDIKDVEKQYENVLCQYDHIRSLITICGESTENVHQVYENLRRLFLSPVTLQPDGMLQSCVCQQTKSNTKLVLGSMNKVENQVAPVSIDFSQNSKSETENLDNVTSAGADVAMDSSKTISNVEEIGGLNFVDHLNESKEIEHHNDYRGGVTDENTGNEQENCVICLDTLTNSKQLKCGHSFCADCIGKYFEIKPVCPTCGTVCGMLVGDQPDGEMVIEKIHLKLLGYSASTSFSVSYYIPAGYQTEKHPTPGAWYENIHRTAYLPDNEEGRKICALLKTAFERRLVFTIGTSRMTGMHGVLTWNDIHHKTDYHANTEFGYPDSTYLDRIKGELAAKFLTEADIDTAVLQQLEMPVGTCKVKVVTHK